MEANCERASEQRKQIVFVSEQLYRVCCDLILTYVRKGCIVTHAELSTYVGNTPGSYFLKHKTAKGEQDAKT